MFDFKSAVEKAELNKTHFFFLGQAGFILKNRSGELLAVDPYLSDCVEKVEGNIGYKRLLPKIIEPNELQPDVLICTHYHRDHYDIVSVPVIMRTEKTKLFCAYDCKADVSESNIDPSRVRFVKPGDAFKYGGFNFRFINCDHGSGAPEAVGIIIETDGKRIVAVGDTCLRLDRVNEIVSEGPVDILVAPINGAYGNLNEEDCVRLTEAVKPKFVVPSHYGMFASHGGAPGLFYDLMQRNNLTGECLLLAQGEKFTL